MYSFFLIFIPLESTHSFKEAKLNQDESLKNSSIVAANKSQIMESELQKLRDKISTLELRLS